MVGYHRETHHFSEGKSTKEFTALQHTRSFCRRFTPTKFFACCGAAFFFFTNKILCSCSIFQNLFLVVDCTTSKCYSCAWKKPDVVSALRLAFFILNLESFISRLNVIPTFRQRRCTNRGRNCVRSKRWSTYTSSGTLYLFLRLNNSETITQKRFWAQR